MRAAAVRHVLFEDLGVLAPLLESRGYEIEYFDAGIDELDRAFEADLVVILGGPIGVGDADAYPFLGDEIERTARRLEAGAPTLGICLGAQLMAAALEAGVSPTGRTEIGFGELELTPEGEASVLAGLAGIPVLHWHGDEFAIPEGADRLAGTPGFPNQAFSLGTNALALQFHVEADPVHIERWLIGHAGELAQAGIDPRALREDAAMHGERLAAAAEEVIGRWLSLLSPRS